MNEQEKRSYRYNAKLDKTNVVNIDIDARNVVGHLLSKMQKGELDSLKKDRKELQIKYEKALLGYKELIEKFKENGFSNAAISEIFKTKITSSDGKIIPIFCPPHQLGLFINKHLPQFSHTKKRKK